MDVCDSPHNRQRKIALVNDLTGFGRCSVAVQLPIVSYLGVQCCVLPTSILSNHTGFPSYDLVDYTDHMRAYAREWGKLGLSFEGICTGFLGSLEQIAIVTEFIDTFKRPGTCVVVDPVMGDYGRPYATYTPQMCAGMRELAVRADVLTPNLTEACILAGEPYDRAMGVERVREVARELSELGPGRVVVTGIAAGDMLVNVCYERGRGAFEVETRRCGEDRSGTGDVFSAVVAADAVWGVGFEESVRRASGFVGRCVARSGELGLPLTDGVCFEEVLPELERTMGPGARAGSGK